MKQVVVGAPAKIIAGVLFEMEGQVIGFDSTEDEVMIKLDAWTHVTMASDYIEQDQKYFPPPKPKQIEMNIEGDGQVELDHSTAPKID